MKFYGSISSHINRSHGILVALVVIFAASILTPTAAHATESSSRISMDDITPAMIDDTVQALESAGAKSTTASDGSVSYDLGNGLDLSLQTDATQTRLGGGREKDGQLYISFNQTDQDVLMTGMGVALGVAICAVPVVGTVACAVVGAIISFGMIAVSKYGKCKSNKQLVVHVNPSWSTCR